MSGLCPVCSSLLVYPRSSYCYCEDCGWPEVDEGGKWAYAEVGEQLEQHQPNLEVFNGKEWVKSLVTYAKLPIERRGLYRYPIVRSEDDVI